MASNGYVLGLDEFTTALRQLGKDEPHVVFQHQPLFGNDVFWRAKFDAAMEHFAERGLLEDGALRPDFQRMLRIIIDFDRSFHGWIEVVREDQPDLKMAVLMAVTDREAVFALRQGNRVRMQWTDPKRAARTMVEQMPEARRNPMRPIVVALQDANSDWPENPKSKASLDGFVRAPRMAMGEFYVSLKTNRGTVEQHRQALKTFDHYDGRASMVVDGYKNIQVVGVNDDDLEKTLLYWLALLVDEWVY